MPREPEVVDESRPLDGWRFLSAGRKMRHDPHDLVVPGGVYVVVPPIAFCWWGLETSLEAADALDAADGPVVCRVQSWGEIARGSGRLAAQYTRVLWMADATAALAAFAGELGGLGVGQAYLRDHPDSMARLAVRVATARPTADAKKEARRGVSERLAEVLMALRPEPVGARRVT